MPVAVVDRHGRETSASARCSNSPLERIEVECDIVAFSI
jgi:hypothetical protein